MAKCGIAKIDALVADVTAASIEPGDLDPHAVGVVQDFLICHGFRNLPGLRDSDHGIFGPLTAQSVQAFRKTTGLGTEPTVDHPTMQKFISLTASEPVACRAYLTLVLDREYDSLMNVIAITCHFEGAGKFGAMNLNSDGAGLSFGIIQWAQKPGRLNELLSAFERSDSALFTTIFGQGDRALADGLVAYTSRSHGGLDRPDPAFDLISPVWRDRFKAAARDRIFQHVQLDIATKDFRNSLANIHAFAPELSCERELAFMVDLANQHGNAGAQSIFESVAIGIPDKLKAMAAESVRRVSAQFGEDSAEAAATRTRRNAFVTTPLLSELPAHF